MTETKTPAAARRRSPLNPIPILDRRLLLQSLQQLSNKRKNNNNNDHDETRQEENEQQHEHDDDVDHGQVYTNRPNKSSSNNKSQNIITEHQLDLFYQQLHKANYPPLSQLVPILLDKTLEKHNHNNNNNNNTKRRVARRERIPELPREFLDHLLHNHNHDTHKGFTTLSSTIQQIQHSNDGVTTKLAIALQDGHVVETVIMRHGYQHPASSSPTTTTTTNKNNNNKNNKDCGNGSGAQAVGQRVTICVSSQVGCAMGCTFCATGTMGIRGNLCSGEILEQLVHAQLILDQDVPPLDNGASSSSSKKKKKKKKKIRNIVFMGMGEPLNNYSNLLPTISTLRHPKLWNLSARHITVSTVGVLSKMHQLTKDVPEVSLALSLHAPTQEMREEIVPTAKRVRVEELVKALDWHVEESLRVSRTVLSSSRKRIEVEEVGVEMTRKEKEKGRKKAMIEYVMLEGKTSTIEAAHQLGKLCQNCTHVMVNLIPYNPTNVQDALKAPSREHIREFQKVVSGYGVFCFVRQTMGGDINGACGQLVVESEEKKENGGRVVGDLEDGPFVAGAGGGVRKESGGGSVKRRNGTISRSIPATTTAKETRSVGFVPQPTPNQDDPQRRRRRRWWTVRDWNSVIPPLAAATAISAACLVVSTVCYLWEGRHGGGGGGGRLRKRL